MVLLFYLGILIYCSYCLDAWMIRYRLILVLQIDFLYQYLGREVNHVYSHKAKSHERNISITLFSFFLKKKDL